MPRTAIPFTDLTANGVTPAPAGTTIDPANGHVINGADTEKLVLVITNTSGAAHNVTVRAGTYPPALASGQGDQLLSVAAGGTGYAGPFDSSHFKRNDGSLWLDFQAGHTGTVTALRIPRGI